jgi:hypothetical protein
MHRYLNFESILSKVISIYKNDGVRGVVARASGYTKYKLFYYLAPLFITIRDKTWVVSFQGRSYAYFYHRWNLTWRNERCIELPIVLDAVQKCNASNVLEIGAVLRHYANSTWTVVDKFEIASGVINQDIENYKPGKKYDLIVSISTLEHVGFDDEVKDTDKINRVMAHITSNLLNSGGIFLFTVPLGYNFDLDVKLHMGVFNLDGYAVYQKSLLTGQWSEVELDSVSSCIYGSRGSGAGELFVGMIKGK